ncbi:hypothetical protein RHMOL_Rhmol08G0019800 [Rhododendron molle]|uniref:Uncharacterized protein n=1 Tax=Rhododendron molle TaxID=49168 RepID=A0ACC0MJ23_RHOML|nr:hypothetical protein RHMOL_Rhmol08G0019800 [Rhododendron molle]
MEGKLDAIFSHKNSRLPDDTVFYSIFPDFSLPSNTNTTTTTTTNAAVTSQLHSLHLQILNLLSPFTSHYIYQHEPFTLSPLSSPVPHLHGKLRYGDNLDDEWFVVFLLLQTSLSFPDLSIRVFDSDGEFLLIESAFHLPRWLNPDTAANRLFLRHGHLHVIPKSLSPDTPTLTQSLTLLINSGDQTLASDPIQSAIKNRIKNYPGNNMNMHRVRVRVPVSVARVLKHEPYLISLAVAGFYDRDIDSMKYAAKMESEMMSAPVRRIDEILALPHSADDFQSQELPPSDDDSWLYNGEDELNAAILERQKEMELYNSKHKGKQKLKEQQDSGPSTEHLDDFGLGDIAKSMQSFVQKMSSYKGAEVPENRNLEGVDFDVDRFMKDLESVIGHQGSDDTHINEDIEEGSSSDSDMDFDDSEDGSDIEPSENNEEGDSFMGAYSNALSEELKTSTLNKSFVRASQSFKINEGTSNTTESMDVQAKSNASEDMDEEFTPVDVDVNLVKSFLDSFSSQQGLPGPASNLLGLMGLRLPQDSSKDK